MEIRQLRYFAAIVKYGTMRAASRALGLSQPALTRSIQKIEQEIDVKLLARDGRRVVPTAAGRSFAKRAELILNECDAASEEAARVQSGDAGEVHIGIGAMFASYIVDAAIADLAKRLPDMHIRVTEGFYEDLVARLSVGQIDMVFMNFTPKGFSADLEFEALTTLSGAAFVHASHRLAKRRRLTPSDALDEHWLVIDQPHALQHHSRIFEEAALPQPRRSVLTNSLVLIKTLLAGGGFIACVPEEMVKDEVAQGLLKRLDFPAFTYRRKAGLIYRAQQYRTPAMTHLADAIRKAATRIVSED